MPMAMNKTLKLLINFTSASKIKNLSLNLDPGVLVNSSWVQVLSGSDLT